MRRAAKFFEYARARQEIYLRRASGAPRPWTRDKILQNKKFCCVFREDDRTTRWFRENVREPLRNRPEVLLATVVFRMLNRISSGEAVFCQTDLAGGGIRSVFPMKGEYVTPFDLFLATGKTSHLKRAILAHCGSGPYVTGAYIISTPPGYTKLDGVMEILRRFHQNSNWGNWRDWAVGLSDRRNKYTLEEAWDWLKTQDYLGKFHSYEIVTDLRHTALLEHAPDIMTWASPGPGARRGIMRVLGKDYESRDLSREELIERMRDLLALSRDRQYWPQQKGGRGSVEIGGYREPLHPGGTPGTLKGGPAHVWPRWEMRDVEHTLCEFDKYERLRLNQGKVKGNFR